MRLMDETLSNNVDNMRESTTSEKIQEAKNTFLKFLEDLKPIADKYDSLREKIINSVNNYSNNTWSEPTMWNYFRVKDEIERKNINYIYEEFQNITREYVKYYHERSPQLKEMKEKLNNICKELKNSGMWWILWCFNISYKIHELFSSLSKKNTFNGTTKKDITKINNLIKIWDNFRITAFTNLLKYEYDKNKEYFDITYYVPYPEYEGWSDSIENLYFESSLISERVLSLFWLSRRIDTAIKWLESI